MPKSSVAALIPLSLLEAIRNLDTPVEDGLDELAEEIVVRRLGLSPTVAAQIQRYRQTAERGGTVELDEDTLGLPVGRPAARCGAGLCRRRPAGRPLRGPKPGPVLPHSGRGLPRGMARRLALRSVARLARHDLRGRAPVPAAGGESSR